MHSPPMPGSERPSIAKLFGRALGLASRACVPLGLAPLVVSIIGAVAAIRGTSDRDQAAMVELLERATAPGGFARLVHVFVHPTVQPHPASALDYVPVLIMSALDPLVAAAVIVIAIATYRGGGATLSTGLAAGAKRYWPMLGLAVLWIATVGIAVGVPIVVAVFVLTGLAFASLVAHVHVGRGGIVETAAIVLAIPFAALLAASVVGVMAFEVSRFACVVEGSGPWRSFVGSLRRTFARAEIRRTLTAGAALTVVQAASVALGYVEWGVGLVVFRSIGAAVVLGVLSGVAFTVFAFAFSAAYYDDLRARESGLDSRSSAVPVR